LPGPRKRLPIRALAGWAGALSGCSASAFPCRAKGPCGISKQQKETDNPIGRPVIVHKLLLYKDLDCRPPQCRRGRGCKTASPAFCSRQTGAAGKVCGGSWGCSTFS
jgi:hypothetical protein